MVMEGDFGKKQKKNSQTGCGGGQRDQAKKA